MIWSVVVVLVWAVVSSAGMGDPAAGGSVFWYLFLNYELVGWLVLMFGLVLCLGVCLRRREGAAAVSGVRLSALQQRAALLALLGLLWCGTLFIYHAYPLSADEFNSVFQAKIFASGQLKALIPEIWRPFAAATTPVYISLDPGAESWISKYLPVYAAMRALCIAIGLNDLLNPLLAVATVLLVADCARRLWPDQTSLPLVAATLLLTSTQFLATSISYYSMPAHLCANLLWLSLYLRNTRWSLALLPWVGGLAMGLHQPVVHPPFVAPFCLDIVRRRRFPLALYCVVVYGAFIVLWQRWNHFAGFEHLEVELQWFRRPGLGALILQAADLTLLASWQSVALVLGGVCALFALNTFSTPLWNLLAGVLLNSLLYFIYVLDQGHGWGHRYSYAVLGNLVLLATYGWLQLAKKLGQARAVRLLVASTCFAIFVQIPLRAFEVEREIRPFARAQAFLRGLPADSVVVDGTFLWYGQDLIRNDPDFAKRPIILNASRVSSDGIKELLRLGRMQVVTQKDLTRFGLRKAPALHKQDLAGHAAAVN